MTARRPLARVVALAAVGGADFCWDPAAVGRPRHGARERLDVMKPYLTDQRFEGWFWSKLGRLL